MPKFVYYSKVDIKRTPIWVTSAKTKEQAIEDFAALKRLTVEQFLNLYEVIEG